MKQSSLALVLAVTACGSSEHALVSPRPGTSSAPTIAKPQEAQQYVLAQNGHRAPTLRVDLPGGGVGFLEAGARVVLDANGTLVGSTPRTESLSRVDAIPAWLGGGFLFRGSDALFRTDEFSGPLVAVTASPSGFLSVTMGTSGLLVVTGDGERFTVDLATGKRSRVEPSGASLFGAVSASRAIAISEGGFAYETSDGGKTWTSLASKLLGTPSDIVVEEAEAPPSKKGRSVFLIEDNGGALRLDESGVARARVGPNVESPDRTGLSTRGEPFLDLAVRVGAPLDDPEKPTLAVVPDGGSLYTVSLATGQVVSVDRGALPPDVPCEAARFSNELLFLCRQSNRAVVASRPLLGGKLKLEAAFPVAGTFVRGGGDTLLFTGPCHAETSKPGQACLRIPRSDSVETAIWSDLDRSAELSDADPKKPVSVLTWVPYDKGAVIVLGGTEGGLLDTRGHTRSRLSEDESRKLSQVFQGSSSEIVERRFHVLDDGTVEGWNPSGIGVRVSDGGKTIVQSAFAFSGARTAGPRALALSPQNTLWQSTDWGQRFVEVAAPSTIGSTPSPRDCSEVGCNLGEWLRAGWEPRVPESAKKLPPTQRRVISIPVAPPLPGLSCVSSGALARKAAAPPPSGRFGFGAKPFPASDHGPMLRIPFPRSVVQSLDSSSLRAFLSAKQPELGADGTARLTDPGTDRQIAYIEAFDPKAVEKRASIKLDALVASVTAQGGTPPELGVEEEAGTALPVLSEAGGLLLFGMSGPPLWVRDKRVVPLTLGAEGSWLSVSSAIETKPEELVVLVAGSDGAEHARRIRQGSAEELFAIAAPPSAAAPQTPDVLAVAPDGSLAVIRVPSASAPTQENPAFLLVSGKPPVPLAPWSTLLPADDPTCADGKGYRAIISSRRPWLELQAGQTEEEHVSVVRVRWSPEHVCLEAAEAAGPSHDLPSGSFESYVVARFGKDAAAGHILVGAGAELREPRTCTLGKPASR